jgi:hypothetical protein
MRSNPDVVLDPQHRVTGRVLVGANLMAGVIPSKANYFLRLEGIKPIAQVGYGHFLFLLPAQ